MGPTIDTLSDTILKRGCISTQGFRAMKTMEILKSVAREGRNNAVDLVRRRLDHVLLPAHLARLDHEIRTRGYALVPDFMPLQECEEIKSWMDETIRTN